MKNLNKISLNEVSESQLSSSCVTKTQQPDAKELNKIVSRKLMLSPTLSAWLLRSHWTLKSILQETLFLDQLHDFSLLLLNSFSQQFLKSKVM